MQLILEISAILVLIVANGVFAMSEIAIVTSRRARLAGRAGEDTRARAALALKDRPTQFLSAVQVGISLVGILAGAFGGARVATLLATMLGRIEWLAPYAGTAAFVLVVAVITYLTLVIGELVPKRIALADPERTARLIAHPMQAVARVARPLVALLSASTNVVVRLLRVRERRGPDVTEDDIRALIAQGARAGVVQELEEDILERVFYLGDRQVRAVMTPRPDIDWIDIHATSEAIAALLTQTRHARFLVCNGTLDRVEGVVHTTDLLAQCLERQTIDLRPLLRQPLVVGDTTPLLEVLRRFRQSDVHLAVVRDRRGAISGILTLNDLLTDLVAHVPGRIGPQESDIVRRDDGSWLIDGTMSLEDVERALGTKLLPLAEARGERTLEEFVVEHLARVPSVGAAFTLDGWRFEIMDMDGRHIDRVLVMAADSGAAC